jgi:DNA helicase TIP49 (TBP-interacting protein)
MPQTIELPDDLADALTDEGARLGLSLPDYAVQLLTSARPLAEPVRNGSELVAFWQTEGVIDNRPDIADSQFEARRLRDEAQRRGG